MAQETHHPGITCRVIDHAIWKNPLKRLLIGRCVVLICRNDRSWHLKQPVPGFLVRGWRVSGIPPEYVRLRKGQGARGPDSLAECILEPLPPIDLGLETETKETVDV
jgi:hypothetical protein